MAGHGHAADVDLRQCPQEGEPGESFIELLGLEQLQLHPIPSLLTTRRQSASHEVAASDALVGGESDALPA